MLWGTYTHQFVAFPRFDAPRTIVAAIYPYRSLAARRKLSADCIYRQRKDVVTLLSTVEPGPPDELLGAQLRAEREARGWTFRKLAEKLSDASYGICDVSDVESIIPRCRWERGTSGIGEHYRTLYCLVFEMGPDLFIISPRDIA